MAHLLALINKYRKRLGQHLLLVLGRLKLFQLKYLVSTRNMALQLIRLQVRNHYYPAMLEGDDEKIDRVIWLSTLHLIHWEPDSDAIITNEEKAQAETVVSSAHIVDGLVDTLATFLGLQKLIFEDSKNPADQVAKTFTYGGVSVLPKQIIGKDVYRIRSKLRVKTNKLKLAISDRKGEKVNLDFSSIAQVLSVISICFLLTGYFYSSTFLSHFGIAATHYFTVSDYLASSVDKAEASVIAIAGALVGMAVGLLHRSRMSEREIRTAQNGFPDWLWNGVKLLFIGILIWFFFTNREQFYRALPIASVYLLLDAVISISKRYFHQPVKAMFTLSFLSLYGLAVFSSVRLDLEQVKSGKYWKNHSETLSLSPDIGQDASNLLLLYSSGQYFFLIQKDSGQAVVIPREKILRIDINKPIK